MTSNPLSSDDKPPMQARSNNLRVRLVTGLAGLTLGLLAVVSGGGAMLIFMALLVTIATLEFYNMERTRGIQSNLLIGGILAVFVVVAFLVGRAFIWQVALIGGALATVLYEFSHTRDLRLCCVRVLTTLGGVFYVAFPGGMALSIRGIEGAGLAWFLAVLGTTWSVDTFSYLFGKIFGKTPLMPHISPNKTVEGAIGGVLVGFLVPLFILAQARQLDAGVVIFLALVPLLAVAGDLFESMMKRFFGVKDSGVAGFNPFPGHGGVLDRVDALLFVIVAYYFFLATTERLALLI